MVKLARNTRFDGCRVEAIIIDEGLRALPSHSCPFMWDMLRDVPWST